MTDTENWAIMLSFIFSLGLSGYKTGTSFELGGEGLGAPPGTSSELGGIGAPGVGFGAILTKDLAFCVVLPYSSKKKNLYFCALRKSYSTRRQR